ncbi:GNAT family N-acetyltransferase [Dyadobacter luteus]|uniref:GNAT family N-acetyltransferase n=1 Tax=Dyadobacter luteus TaxID=2259619 RepID=A0A3D8Y6B9_9BACT|nr:GNAT family N-acetyltransferase [Dyadobacter luteus]REA58084.1 GNAT family N-acetyltransferase [Dyadobacter luteus]
MMVITKADIEDLASILQIAKETFFETFAPHNSQEDMEQYAQDKLTLGKLQGELLNPDSQFYILSDAGRAVGYLKVNFGSAQTELHDEASMEIERIYVKSEYHGKKLGQLLYDKALEVAAGSGVTYIWLGVWEENAKATRFYEKNGFVAFDKHAFRMGTDEQTDIMMKKVLV